MVKPMLLEVIDWLRHSARRRAWPRDRALGRRGEDLAHRFLGREGFKVVARNWCLGSGQAELDLVAWEGEALVFVEVKSRESVAFGPPERAIGREKELHLLRAAREYARRAETPWERVRFDVVTVVFSDPPQIAHFRDVIRTL